MYVTNNIQMDTIIVGIISAVASIAAAIVAWASALEAQKLGTAQNRLATHTASAEWQRDLRDWAFEAIDVLAEASYTCTASDKAGGTHVAELRSCRHRLSALVDQGRLYLPNQVVKGVGDHKQYAYRGWRHAALDPLVAAERVLSGDVGSGRFPSRGTALISMRREFVSGIQRILAPDSRNREIVRLVQSVGHRTEDKTLGGLLPDDNSAPTGANRLLLDEQSVTVASKPPVV